jgi:hypothetical protein
MITQRTQSSADHTTEPVAESPSNPFATHSDVLATAEEVFAARAAWQKAIAADTAQDKKLPRRLERKYRKLRSEWHARCEASSLAICRRAVEAGLSWLERELLWGALSLSTSAASKFSRHSGDESCVANLVAHIEVERRDRLAALAFLSPDAALAKHQLLHIRDDEDDALGKAAFMPAADVLEQLFEGRQRTAEDWTIEHEHELYDALRGLYAKLDWIACLCKDFYGSLDMSSRKSFWEHVPQRDRLWDRLFKTIERHPAWSWNRPEVLALDRKERQILIALAGAAVDVVPEESALLTGRGLISTFMYAITSVPCYTWMLTPDQRLVKEGWVRPASGSDSHADGSDHEVANTVYELGDRAYEVIAVERSNRGIGGGFALRSPSLSLAQLALAPSIEQAIRLTVTQAEAGSTLLKAWGLAERIQYGLHPVLLFYGPPGTGKTATAEALAYELKRPLIVADYSKLACAYVGNTEKNIVRVFREAQRRKAVLFWDEADAMLYDRDSALRSWEVRDVNVILQQIERFEGVCILATNRRQALDKALARRISMQVEFQRPDSMEERLGIWRAMLPPQLPLGPDVDLEILAREDLSGGEIKNVLLNAARFAAARGERAPALTAEDFRQAVQWETKTKEQRQNTIGFGGSHGFAMGQRLFDN